MNKIGLHARPATMRVSAAEKFESDLTLRNKERTATAKSMISLLSLRAKINDTITVESNGRDEKETINTLIALINSKFGEE